MAAVRLGLFALLSAFAACHQAEAALPHIAPTAAVQAEAKALPTMMAMPADAHYEMYEHDLERRQATPTATDVTTVDSPVEYVSCH